MSCFALEVGMNEIPENDNAVNPYAPTIRATGGADDPSQFLASLASLSSEHDNDRLVPPGHRPCPICGSLMQMRPRASINIDICADHGVWLDNGKLESIAENTSVSSRLRYRRDIEKVRSQEKIKGIFGWLSFFLD